ncbi:MAG: formate/nitrite transporter family protein [Spirochaetes bacterium]|nr:formate/nitrite transporter family protein [Spirochaetota bacterium]
MPKQKPTSPDYDPKHTVKEVQQAISKLGIKKANTHGWQLFLLGVLAGIYISFGGHAYLVTLEQGMGRIIGGAVFSVGLVLITIAGAELFTGNVTMVVGTITRLYSFRKMLRSWAIVYLGNFIGSYLFAMLLWNSGVFGGHGNLNKLGELAVSVANAKMAIPFWQAFIRGIFCNILVLLAIILSYFSKDVISKIFCCVLPIMVFVASGFEHCVANMYLIPAGLFAQDIPIIDQYVMWKNLVPVTLGNIVGGIFILVVHPNRIRQIVTLFGNRNASKPV